ncbi:MAG: flagellar hook assembly protein FlgD [Deferrisomatales bacterium]
MAITGAAGAAGTAATPPKTTAKAGGTTGLADFDQFLKLFVSQLKYQDPLSPASGEDFLAQTAQFTSVEQLVALNRKAADNLDAMDVFRRSSSAGFIGKRVEAAVPADDGSVRAVSGRVVQVRYAQDGTFLFGLEDGSSVRFSEISTVSEL